VQPHSLKPYFATDIVAKGAKNATATPDGIVVALPSFGISPHPVFP
jgi:hypothetical protein